MISNGLGDQTYMPAGRKEFMNPIAVLAAAGVILALAGHYGSASVVALLLVCWVAVEWYEELRV